MPVLITTADVSFFSELARRLGAATATVDRLAAEAAALLATTSWTGSAADAAQAEAARLSGRLRTTTGQLHGLTGTATRLMHARASQLARQRVIEATVLHDFDRLAAIPGDLELRARSVVHTLHLRALVP